MKKKRIDELLVEYGLVNNIDEARRFLMAGIVVADDKRIDKAGDTVSESAFLRLKNQSEFVSRGGYKLKSAIESFEIDFKDKIVIDIGSSTGGFTDAALKYGAKKVYAIDVGVGIIHNRLRTDERVQLLEGVNFRTLGFDAVGEKVDIAVADLSFISLTMIIENLVNFLKDDAFFIPLIKPQFEADRGDVGDGGIVRDETVRQRAISKVITFAESFGFSNEGLITSPITGAKGNIEYLAKLQLLKIGSVD